MPSGVLPNTCGHFEAVKSVHEKTSEKSWSAVHKLEAAAGSSKLMGGTWCRPYLTQMPGGAGRMPGFFPLSGIILPDILSGT
jgi:hypothetical protein